MGEFSGPSEAELEVSGGVDSEEDRALQELDSLLHKRFEQHKIEDIAQSGKLPIDLILRKMDVRIAELQSRGDIKTMRGPGSGLSGLRNVRERIAAMGKI